ncbi:MAG: VWA domain-containing protein [Halioglobus sp.]|nr:VWA domain-containing protein [Halioglobus sp.]
MPLHFMRPEWLWTLLPALFFILILWRLRGQQGSWHSVIAPDLLPFLVSDADGSRGRNLLPAIALGWLVAAIAASGPSWQKIPQPIHQKQDALVVILDLSYSMKSADLQPSRLDRARQKILDLLQQRREGQTGLIAYAGDAHIVTPLTDDIQTIANLLPALHPDMMPLRGSAPVSAVAQGLELLQSAGIRTGKILLVTDGVSERDLEEIEKLLRGSNAQLDILGVGTSPGAPIPMLRGGFVKDKDGAIVLPGLDEKNLRQLADATGGRYRHMQIDDADIDYLLADNTLRDSEETLALDRTADTWEDQGYLFILALLPLALGLFRRGWLLSLLPLFFLAQPQPAVAQNWDDLWLTPDQQGQRALEQGNDEAAADLFENSDWAGTAAYQSGNYESAIEHFDDKNTADSLYNRGNALARAGQLDEAIASYEESLGLKPEQTDAAENLELLKRLKEQQQQEQQNGEGEGEDKDQDQGQDQDGEQDQSQQQDQNKQQDQNQGEGEQQNENQEGQDSEASPQDQSPGDDEEQQQYSQEQLEQEQEQEQSENSQGQPPDDEQTEEQNDTEATTESESEKNAEEEQATQPAQVAPGDQERDQATEQWLRRVPDDPSGLLREKFRYESLRRQEEGAQRSDEVYW